MCLVRNDCLVAVVIVFPGATIIVQPLHRHALLLIAHSQTKEVILCFSSQLPILAGGHNAKHDFRAHGCVGVIDMSDKTFGCLRGVAVDGLPQPIFACVNIKHNNKYLSFS